MNKDAPISASQIQVEFYYSIIKKMILAVSRSKDFAPGFYEVAREIQKESERAIDKIARNAANILTRRFSNLGYSDRSKNISKEKMRNEISEALTEAYDDFKGADDDEPEK